MKIKCKVSYFSVQKSVASCHVFFFAGFLLISATEHLSSPFPIINYCSFLHCSRTTSLILHYHSSLLLTHWSCNNIRVLLTIRWWMEIKYYSRPSHYVTFGIFRMRSICAIVIVAHQSPYDDLLHHVLSILYIKMSFFNSTRLE